MAKTRGKGWRARCRPAATTTFAGALALAAVPLITPAHANTQYNTYSASVAGVAFKHTYGAVDNTQFITLLYQNVLDRAPDAGGLQFHLGESTQGQSRSDMLIHFSESPENQANVIGDIQNGMVYVWG